MAESQDEPEIRRATLDDAPAMLRVLEAAFDPWPPFEIDQPPLDHLRWKMSVPGLPTAHSVAVVDGQIVAVSVRWVSQLRLGDELLVQDSSVDHAVHPDFQGRGLGGAIARGGHAAAIEYSDLSLGTGSSHERIPSIFDQVDEAQVTHLMPMRSRPFGPRAFLATHRAGGATGIARNALRALGRRLSPRVRRRAPASGARIEVLQSFDERVEPLWGAFMARFDFAVERSVDYLNWRYCDPRAGRSVVLGAFEDGAAAGDGSTDRLPAGDRLVGFAVFKASNGWSHVLDLVVDPAHPQAAALARELLDDGCRRMREVGARGAHLALSVGHPAVPVVEAAGFLPVGWSVQFTCGAQRRGRSSPLLDRMYAGEARTHLVLGDADIY